MLELSQVSKRYRDRTVLQALDYRLEAGQYVAIMGESGSGKSTLLNLIAGLDTPDSGHIRFQGQDLAAAGDDARTLIRRAHIGFIYQAFHLLPYLTVQQNVMVPLMFSPLPAHERRERVVEALHAVGMAQRLESRPGELSGGEMQRVAIARALVHRPRLILADEPTGNLDADNAAAVLTLLRQRLGADQAGILVTHSLAAARSADEILVLRREGLVAYAP